MNLGIFAILDTAVNAWMPPIYFRNKGEAMRWFMDSVNNTETKLNKHPSDFVMFELGIWSDSTAEFDTLKAPVRVALAAEVLQTAV